MGAGDIEFNTDVLDLSDRTNIDLSRFARSGFILPGNYSMVVQLNNQPITEQSVAFYPPDNDPKGSQACLAPAIVEQLGLKASEAVKLLWWKNGQCLDPQGLPGMEVSADLATSTLNINLPQAYLEYSAINWDPPSRWDEGGPGLLVDYNMTAQSSYRRHDGMAPRPAVTPSVKRSSPISTAISAPPPALTWRTCRTTSKPCFMRGLRCA